MSSQATNKNWSFGGLGKAKILSCCHKIILKGYLKVVTDCLPKSNTHNALKRKNFRFFNEGIESTLHKGKVLCYQMIVSMNTKATK